MNDKDEPRPLDPKEASRLIGKALKAKKDPSARDDRPAGDAAASAPKAAESLAARPVPSEEIVDLLQRTPETLAREWIRQNDEESPLRAKRVSLTEIDIIIGSRRKK